MPLRVRLLGRPGLEHDGKSRRLEGYKPWALLTYLLLESRAPTRRELADLLWSEADDPLGAVRWSLSQVRKAVNPPAEIGERDGRIKIDAEVLVVDAGELLRGEWNETSIDDLVRGELLEGMSFGEAPSFDTWLQVQRARTATAAADALRWAATLLSHREPDRALALAERALRSEPFDDVLHALILGSTTYTGGGLGTAREWTSHLQRALRLANELGDRATVAQIETERGRISAIEGRYEAAEASFRRARRLAEDIGDTREAGWARAMLALCHADRCEYAAAEEHLRAA